MECPKCKSINPDDKKYCGDCGGVLSIESRPILDLADPHIRKGLQDAVKDQLKDQKVVEIEITQAIAARLSDWAKLFGFFVGIPLAVFAIVLGFLGFKTFSDFASVVDKAQRDVTGSLQQAQREADTLRTEADSLKADYQNLKTQFGDIRTLSQEVVALSATVKQLSDKIGFKPSKALTSELQSNLSRTLTGFQEYLQKLGYRSKAGKVDVFVDSAANNEFNAFYDPSKNLIVIGASIAEDSDTALRAFAHHALMTTQKSMVPDDYASIESGLADYFSCSFRNNPLIGEKSARVLQKHLGKRFDKAYIRNLDNVRKFHEASPGSAHQDEGEIWGGAFWDIRKLLGQDAADKVLFVSWASAQIDKKSNARISFVRWILQTSQSLVEKKHIDQIRLIFESRGITS